MIHSKLPKRNQVILVDDDENEHFIMGRYFQSWGIRDALVSFQDGKEFLNYMAKVTKGEVEKPAFVLMDVRMPGWDGFKTVSELRKSPEFSAAPVVLMYSTSDAPSDIDKAQPSGADAYYVKPLGLDEIAKLFEILFNKYL